MAPTFGNSDSTATTHARESDSGLYSNTTAFCSWRAAAFVGDWATNGEAVVAIVGNGVDDATGDGVGAPSALASADSVSTSPQPALAVVVCTTSVRDSTGIAPRIVKPGIVRFTVAEPLESDV